MPAPSHLSPTEAASFGFTGMTFLSSLGAFPCSLSMIGPAPEMNFKNKRVLVIGATGGLGSLGKRGKNTENFLTGK